MQEHRPLVGAVILPFLPCPHSAVKLRFLANCPAIEKSSGHLSEERQSSRCYKRDLATPQTNRISVDKCEHVGWPD